MSSSSEMDSGRHPDPKLRNLTDKERRAAYQALLIKAKDGHLPERTFSDVAEQIGAKCLWIIDKMFGTKWPDCYAVLYQDSTFVWYDSPEMGSARGCLQLKPLAGFLVVGAYTDRLKNQRPQLPEGGHVNRLIAIGAGAKSSAIHWFLCSSDAVFNDWMTQIVKTLPPPPPPPAQPQQAPSQMQGQVPQQIPAAPPGQYMRPQMQQYARPSYPPQRPGYAAQPNTTTVVIADQTRYGRNDDGFTTGLLMGGMMGYGMGHGYGGYGYGHGFGWGGGLGYGGFGGGYYGGGGYMDNDTTIINNYNTDVNNVSNDYSNDYNNYGDSYDYDTGGGGYDNGGDYGDYGGGDYDGGGDYGGGDFDGGGDFGGGDF